MTAVSIRKLGISYGSLAVLRDLDLEVREGEFIVLLGPSGCGKSTLLNAIAGLLDISEGQIWIKGKNVTWSEPKDRGIGMVFQSYALYPRMTVAKNLSFGLEIAKVPRDEIANRLKFASELLHIEDLMHRRPIQLSGGQRQRVAMGRALVRKVDVFLFDEPLSNLDAALRTELRVELKKLHAQLNSTMIYVTHDQIEALTLADRVAVMNGGVIQQLATPKEIYQRPINRFVAGFVGSPAMNFISGELRGDNAGTLVCPNGITIGLNGYEFVTSPTGSRTVVLGLRPEQLHFVRQPDETSVLPVQLNLVEPMGADSLVWGSVGDNAVSIRIGPDDVHEIGKVYDIHFRPRLASVFDAGTGARL